MACSIVVGLPFNKSWRHIGAARPVKIFAIEWAMTVPLLDGTILHLNLIQTILAHFTISAHAPNAAATVHQLTSLKY